jgi:hypothetical protein
LTQDKAIRLESRPLIPRDIIESDKSLQAYLEENVIQNRQDEKIRLRIAKARQTWTNKRLEAAARKIKVEPSGGFPSEGQEPIQQTMRRHCKKQDKPVTEEPREGTLVTEQIKGIVTVCNNCNHTWVHHSKNLGKQYYASCPRCHYNCRLKHYKVG